MDKNFLLRSTSGAIYGLIIFFCTTPFGALLLEKTYFQNIRQEYIYMGLISVLLLASIWECAKVMKFGNNWWKWLLFPTALLVYYRFISKYIGHSFYQGFNLSDLLAIVLVIIGVFTLFKSPKELYYDNGKFIFSIVYLVIPFGFALAIPERFMGNEETFGWEVFMLFVLIFSSDTFAYLAGRFFGKHKMAPKISPKKTWEGFAGGLFFTLIIGILIELYFPTMKGNWIVVGLLVSIFAPLGDLVESQLKRTFGVKDSGVVIPGHGGILDRLDSFILCSPVVYLYFITDKLI